MNDTLLTDSIRQLFLSGVSVSSDEKAYRISISCDGTGQDRRIFSVILYSSSTL